MTPTDYILLDTCVLSDARKQKPPPQVKEFVLGLHGCGAITNTSIFELQRGASEIEKYNPGLALEYSDWLENLLATNVYLIPDNASTARLIARMTACPPLRNFWLKHENSDKLVFGSDPAIAAASIVHEIPIATRNIRDFLHIHKHFPLPGLYDPMVDYWHVPPPVGWAIEPSSDSIKDEKWLSLFRLPGC